MNAVVRFLNRRRFMEIFFGNWRWVRRACGGRWECWWVDVCGSAVWMQHDSRTQGRIPCTHGTPLVEEWDKPNTSAESRAASARTPPAPCSALPSPSENS